MLGFFLASWGMYRGSYFLLKDYTYTIHKNVIEKIWEERTLLRKQFLEDEDIEPLFSLKEILEKYYSSKKATKTKPSQVLISKIIMGVSGLVPAYDRNVVKALNKRNLYQTFNEKSYKQLHELYKQNKKEFATLTAKKYKQYPPMKFLDILLWEGGKK